MINLCITGKKKYVHTLLYSILSLLLINRSYATCCCKNSNCSTGFCKGGGLPFCYCKPYKLFTGSCATKRNDGEKAFLDGDEDSCKSGKETCGYCGSKNSNGKKCSKDVDCESGRCDVKKFTLQPCTGVCSTTRKPTPMPSNAPTRKPTPIPSNAPSISFYPSQGATVSFPKGAPFQDAMFPTSKPTEKPSPAPTDLPTKRPTPRPSAHPTEFPSYNPTLKPSESPSKEATSEPLTISPSYMPSVPDSMFPTLLSNSPSSSSGYLTSSKTTPCSIDQSQLAVEYTSDSAQSRKTIISIDRKLMWGWKNYKKFSSFQANTMHVFVMCMADSFCYRLKMTNPKKWAIKKGTYHFNWGGDALGSPIINWKTHAHVLEFGNCTSV